MIKRKRRRKEEGKGREGIKWKDNKDLKKKEKTKKK